MFHLCFIRKKGKKILQQLKRQAHGLLKQKGASTPALCGLAMTLNKEVTGEEEEAESRDMEEAEGELDGIHTEGSVDILNTAPFWSGGQETTTTMVKMKTSASKKTNQSLSPLFFIS